MGPLTAVTNRGNDCLTIVSLNLVLLECVFHSLMKLHTFTVCESFFDIIAFYGASA